MYVYKLFGDVGFDTGCDLVDATLCFHEEIVDNTMQAGADEESVGKWKLKGWICRALVAIIIYTVNSLLDLDQCSWSTCKL